MRLKKQTHHSRITNANRSHLVLFIQLIMIIISRLK